MKELLFFLDFDGYQDVEKYIRSLQLPRGKNSYLPKTIGVVDCCLVLYLLIIKKVEIQEVDNTKLLVHHNFCDDNSFVELKKQSPGLYELFSRSKETGFIIIKNPEYCIQDFILNKQKKLGL